MAGEVETDLHNDSIDLETNHDDGSHSPADSGIDTDAHENETDEGQEGQPAGSERKDPAGSSEKKGPEGRLDRVLNMLKGKNKLAEAVAEKPVAKTPGTEGDTAPAEKPADDGKKPADPAAVVPPEVANHPAFKTMQTQLQHATVMVQRQQAIVDFVQQNNIKPEDMTRAYSLTALANKDPEAFYAEICKIQQDYALHLGKVLPADIQADIDAGAISEERGKELAKARVDKKISEQRAAAAETRVSTTEQETSIAQTKGLVERWFSDQAKKDPALPAKTEAIQGEILRLKQQFGPPQNAQEQLNLMNAAYDNVTKRMRSAMPARKPTRATPPASGNAPGAAATTGKTRTDKMAGLVEGVLNKHRS